MLWPKKQIYFRSQLSALTQTMYLEIWKHACIHLDVLSETLACSIYDIKRAPPASAGVRAAREAQPAAAAASAGGLADARVVDPDMTLAIAEGGALASEDAPPEASSIDRKLIFYKLLYPAFIWNVIPYEESFHIALGAFRTNNKKFPLIYRPYWDLFVKYISALRWESDEANSKGVTFYEMVVDFELATGSNIRHPKYGNHTPWNVKAEIIKKMYTFVMLYYPQYDTPAIKRTIRTFMVCRPHPDTGLVLRYRLLMGDHASIAIVRNLNSYLTAGSAGLRTRTRTGAINHILDYRYLRVLPIITSETTKSALRFINNALERRRNGILFRLRGKQKIRRRQI